MKIRLGNQRADYKRIYEGRLYSILDHSMGKTGMAMLLLLGFPPKALHESEIELRHICFVRRRELGSSLRN
jgi:hypothetical protein